MKIPCRRCDGSGYEPNHLETGQEMRIMREREGVSLLTLAKACRVSAAYLSDLERGRRNWNERLKVRYLQALDHC